jgi:hypothetical protein
MTIDTRFIVYWSRKYWDALTPERRARETSLFVELGPRIRLRGSILRRELVEVASWKSPRPKHWVAMNSDADIRRISRAALASKSPIGHLTKLKGVGIPTASAILAVAEPTRFTIIDVRTTRALAKLGELESSEVDYESYLVRCLAIVATLRPIDRSIFAPLRLLDQALWKYDLETRRPSRDAMPYTHQCTND